MQHAASARGPHFFETLLVHVSTLLTEIHDANVRPVVSAFALDFIFVSQEAVMDGTRKTVSVGFMFRGLMVASILAMTCAMLQASTIVKNNTPGYVATAKNSGAEDPAKVIEVSIWLQLHNRDQFDALTESLYDRTSPNYRHWLMAKDIARFAPTAQEAKTVQ
jgi:hypothetical protein